jgi:hypothetical protein
MNVFDTQACNDTENLSALCEMFTLTTTNKVYKHLKKNNITTEQQKDCKRESEDCKNNVREML